MKTRIIHTKMWTDEYFSTLGLSEKLLFIYVISNDLVGMTGKYEVSDRKIMFDTGLNIQQLEKAKQQLTADGKVAFIDGWVIILNNDKYQNYKGAKNETAYEKEEESLPDHIRGYSIDRVSGFADTPINHKSKIINHKSFEGVETFTEEKPQQKKYSLIADIGQPEMQEIAAKYQVPETFVISKLDDLQIWHDKNPRKNKYANYLAGLRDWVKRDALKIKQDGKSKSKLTVIS